MRISLSDVAEKLLLDTGEDAEYIVAKVIRDGVVEATIDHENSYVQSKETLAIYSTREPMNAFHQRIAFCLDIHNQSVKETSKNWKAQKRLRRMTLMSFLEFRFLVECQFIHLSYTIDPFIR